MDRKAGNIDITWFLDLASSEKLDLSPKYQRRSVWTRKDRLFFLDTIFKGYPCPAIFLHKTIDINTGQSTYHVVDGKQRLETIILFANNRITLPKDESAQADAELRGKKFKDLSPEYKQKFWNYSVAVDMLDIIDHAVVDEIFDRLNRNSRKLDRQELRHAKYEGWFIRFAENQSEENEKWKNLGIVTSGRAKRMKDVQFISELMISSIEQAPQGFSQDEIDEYCAYYDDPEEDRPNFVIEDFEDKFERILDFLIAVNDKNGCVKDFARSFMHFYSLWNFVDKHLGRLDADSFSEVYLQFMQTVNRVNTEDIIEGEEKFHEVYSQNSVGANTELPQRKARLEALEGAILG